MLKALMSMLVSTIALPEGAVAMATQVPLPTSPLALKAVERLASATLPSTVSEPPPSPTASFPAESTLEK